MRAPPFTHEQLLNKASRIVVDGGIVLEPTTDRMQKMGAHGWIFERGKYMLTRRGWRRAYEPGSLPGYDQVELEEYRYSARSLVFKDPLEAWNFYIERCCNFEDLKPAFDLRIVKLRDSICDQLGDDWGDLEDAASIKRR